MHNVLSYHVYNSETKKWLCDDEKSWHSSFHQSASFISHEVANGIMEREGGDYVFACMGSM